MLLGLLLYRTRQKNKVEVMDLTVKDSSGAIVAHLGPDRYGTCLDLTVRSGASKAALCVDTFYGANLDLSNRNPETRASLSAGKKIYEAPGPFVPGLHIEGENGQSSLNVNLGQEAELVLGHYNSGNSVVLLGGKEPGVRVEGANGKTVWFAPHGK